MSVDFPRVYFFPTGVMQEPQIKRAVVFIDGQNLFHAAKAAFGYREPTYDVHALATIVCAKSGWVRQEIRFYTGLPDQRRAGRLLAAWNAKLARMGHQGIVTQTRTLRYAGTPPVGREKGIDIRIALDVVRLGRLNCYDVGLIFSQDQDLVEAVNEIKEISKQQRRWIKIASAFPQSAEKRLNKGIYGTDWIPIDSATYARCVESAPFYALHRSPAPSFARKP
jgi:uncharacterized LabA/DUF88 family protein